MSRVPSETAGTNGPRHCFVTGFNYQHTPLALRERYFLGAPQIEALLHEVCACSPLHEFVVLCTCNRLEAYAVTDQLDTRVVPSHFLRMIWPDMPAEDFEQLREASYLHAGEACVRHLFRVTSGLDSMVKGEPEIVAQVKQAYQCAQASGSTGPALNRLFQRALSVSKEVRTRFQVSRGPVSVGSVAVEHVQRACSTSLEGRNVMVVGAGKMGATTLGYFARRTRATLWLANRTPDRAREAARQGNARVIGLDRARTLLPQMDAVITAATVEAPLFTAVDFTEALAGRRDPLVLVDLAVPRNIDPAVGACSGIHLVNIDDMKDMAEANLSRRQQEGQRSEAVVSELAATFAAFLESTFYGNIRRGEPAADSRVPMMTPRT